MNYSMLKNNHFFFLITFLSVLLVSCGLPSYDIPEPPVPIKDTSQSRILYFKTPDDDSIQGYIFYYKIYSDLDTSLMISDRDDFEDNLEEDTNSLEGNTLPQRLNFYPLGEKEINAANYPQPLFEVTSESNRLITLDFTPVLNDTSSDPIISLEGISEIYDVRRGIVDSRLSSDQQDLLSFTDFDFPKDDSNSYYDQDLNDLCLRMSGEMPDYINVGICVISFAFSNDPSSGSFNTYSLPVFLGVVKLIPLEDSDRF